MSQEINRQELIRSLRNLFGFRGSTNFDLGESVIPVATIADLERPPFHNKVGGVVNATQAAVAAQFSYIGLTVPLSAGKQFRTTVRGIFIQAATAGQNCTLGLTTASALAAAGIVLVPVANPPGSWDSVFSETATDVVRPQSTAGIVTLGALLFQNNGLKLQVPTTPSLFIPLDWNICAGNTLLIQCETVNVQFTASFYFDEYVIG